MAIDLHTHSTASDGRLTPTELVRAARVRNLKVIALCDHDSVGGVGEALAAGRSEGVVVVPAVELSAEDETGLSLHVIGYFVDHLDTALLERLDAHRAVRISRAEEMVSALGRAGFAIRFHDVLARAEGGAVGRVHVAQELVARGFVKSVRDAFDTLIGRDGPYYVHKPVPSADEVIRTILDAGGVAVLAHPTVSRVEHLVPALVQAGLEGIEAYHTQQPPEDADRLVCTAAAQGLVATGGSDFHGHDGDAAELGGGGVPDAAFDHLLATAGQRTHRLLG